VGDLVIAIAVAIALAYLAYVWWRYDRTSPYQRPIVLPKAVRVVPSFGPSGVILPGSIWPFEFTTPVIQVFFFQAHRRSRIIGIAPGSPASGGIICAARVVEARYDGKKVAAIIQGVARVRLIAKLPSSEWSIELITDSEEAKDRASLAAQRIRQLALRVVDRARVPPQNLQALESTTDLTALVDVAAGVCDLPRDIQIAVLATEDVPERFSILRKALEERAARG
jgi:hypothetical protein